MFIQTPRVNSGVNGSQRRKSQTMSRESTLSQIRDQTLLPKGVIEDLIDGILILTEQRELIYANDCARRILRQLNRGGVLTSLVPKEVWHICQTLIESRSLFPEQYWLIESKIFVSSSVAFNVRARWLKLDEIEHPCLLLIVRDQYQNIKDIAIEEAQKYGLTSREKEIWLLHRASYTYKQVAAELCITPNTVKKHMKSIYSKQKSILGLQEPDQECSN